jgi:hypothetical protein
MSDDYIRYWKKHSKRTDNGAWDWFSPSKPWKGHEGDYAEFLKLHPDCDPTSENYREDFDSCLA